jgi:hypothetical protein
MLVYAPGQFFVEHQDSEKDDAMVASLVVGLPSTFKGGALEIRHRGQTATYRGSKKALSFVAFYGDCRHQVKPVRAGYRVVLTYNLLLGAETAASGTDLDPELVGEVGNCLDEHFASPTGTNRLVYLLDHEYTRRGLDRSRLKGSDAERARLLVKGAEGAGYDAVLALANVHETWSAYKSEDRWYGRSGHSRWDDWDDADDDVDGGETEEYDLEELVESEVTLDSWIDPREGKLKNVGLSVGDDEMCASTPSGELEPYSSEYEGYMGNWGNTLDRWYHRGAVVVWPVSRAFAVQAEASPSFALDAVAARARTGDLAGAREATATVAPFWDRVAARVESKGRGAHRGVVRRPTALPPVRPRPGGLDLLAATALPRVRGGRGRRNAGGTVTVVGVLELGRTEHRTRPRIVLAEPSRADPGPTRSSARSDPRGHVAGRRDRPARRCSRRHLPPG